MSELRPGGNRIAVVAVVVCLLLGLYVGAYCWSMEATVLGRASAPYYDLPMPPQQRHLWHPAYEIVFAPIHWLDRRIRPHVWEPKP